MAATYGLSPNGFVNANAATDNMNTNMLAIAVLTFWFGGATLQDPMLLPNTSGMWFASTDYIDTKIKTQFPGVVRRAAAGEFDHWKENHEMHLALILVLDQFSRNVFRGSAQAYHQDPKALELVRFGLDRGYDEHLLPIQRVFLYMPLMHAEDLETQDLSVQKFEALAKSVPENTKLGKFLKTVVKYAHSHREDIKQFGHFPSRSTTHDLY